MSTPNRVALHESMIRNLRYFIAGTILFNQKVADKIGLHLTDMQCLNLLELLGPTTPGKLSEFMGLSTGGVTVMLDRLEKAGFARREPNPGDRRSSLVRICPGRMKKVHPLYAKINRQMEMFLTETPPAELQSVVKFFGRMNALRMGPMQT